MTQRVPDERPRRPSPPSRDDALQEESGATSHAGIVRANGKPLISAIVPTHNRAGLLPEALRSIYAQEGAGVHFDVEIVVVDDASTDATPALINEHPAVRYIRLPVNRGASAARNAGIRASRGRYVAFLDDDDIWLPDKLLRQVRALEAHPEAPVVYSPYLVRVPGGGEHANVRDDAPSGSIFRALLLRGNHCGTPIAMLVRRDAFDAAGGFDEGLPTGEDYDMWLRLAFQFPFLFVPGPVAIRQRSRDGKYARHLAAGDASHGRSTRYVVERAIVEKALGLLPRTEAAGALTQQALAVLETRIASALCDHGQFESMRAQLMGGFQRTPWLARYALPRSSIAQMWSRFAMTMDAPIPTTSVFCRELTRAARGHGLKHWAQMRRLLGMIWKELGIQLASAGRHREAGYAAARALAQNPLLMGRKTLPRLITQVGMAALRRARISSRLVH
jgi:Glycosyl transferase family 2